MEAFDATTLDTRCPAGHMHYRLTGDETGSNNCGACEHEIVHAGAVSEGNDYAVWCTNKACRFHLCFECGDMECPAWAHGQPEHAYDLPIGPERLVVGKRYTAECPQGEPVYADEAEAETAFHVRAIEGYAGAVLNVKTLVDNPGDEP